jgi:hypothetical protein
MATDYGRCISVTDDLPLRWSIVTGPRVVAEAIIRRWSTPRGSLPYDLDYGTDARDLLGDTVGLQSNSEMAQALAREAEKDERVDDCNVVVKYDIPAETAIITAAITLAEGVTFRLVAAVDAVTVALLRVN